MSYEVIGWLIAIVVFIAAEAATVALVSVWFIGGAVCALAAAILGAGLPCSWQSFWQCRQCFWRSSARSPGRNGRKSPSA